MLPDKKNDLMQQCATSLGLTRSEVFGITATAPKRYKVYQIPKRTVGHRTICQPSRELKALQYFFLEGILRTCPTHYTATAYQRGVSLRENAAAHLGSRVLMKLDFTDFFRNIRVEHWRKYTSDKFPDWSIADRNFSEYVMFWGDGGYTPVCLSIGAPTSPCVSNVVMYEFDAFMNEKAIENGLVYTRYADDITISSKEYIDMKSMIDLVEAATAESRIPNLKLNQSKTHLVSKSRSRRVTGLIISNDDKVSLGRARKRLISAMVHKAKLDELDVESTQHLRGLLAFSNDIEPTFIESLVRKYGSDLIDIIFQRD